MFDGIEGFADPRFPLAMALIAGGLSRPGPTQLPQMLMQSVPQSATLAQLMKREQSFNELGQSGVLAGPTGLNQEQSAALAKALGRGGEGGALGIANLVANAPNRGLAQQKAQLEIDALRGAQQDRSQAQQAWQQLFGGQGAGQSQEQGASSGRKMLMFAMGMPGMSAGQRAGLEAMIRADEKDTREPFANEFNRAAYSMFGRMPTTQAEMKKVADHLDQQKVFERAAIAGAAAAGAASGTASVQRNLPMGGGDLVHYIDEFGDTPPVGTSANDLQRAGNKYRAVTGTIASGAPKIQGTYALIGRMRELTDKLNTKSGAIDRAVAGGQAAWQQYAQTDPDVNLYTSLSQGALSNMIRALGEVGNVADLAPLFSRK